MPSIFYFLLIWLTLALITAPFLGRLLAHRSDPTPDELLSWVRALGDDEATERYAAKGGDA